MLTKTVLAILLLFITVTEILSQEDEGGSCTLTSGSPGICRPLPNCISAIKKLRQGHAPSRCGFTTSQPFNEIICCPLLEVEQSTRPSIVQTSLRISEKKCLEYSEFVYKNVTKLEDGKIQHHQVLQCDFVIGDDRTTEFPHMVLLGYGDDTDINWTCAGILISDRYVLTVAHCTRSLGDRLPKMVKLGDFTSNESHPIDIPIDEIITHPDFESRKVYNDIALVRLNESVTFNAFIRPACLPKEFRIPTKKATTTGFELSDRINSDTRQMVHKFEVDFISNERCNGYFGSAGNRRISNGIVDATQVCAILENDNDNRNIRSGGSLQIYHSELPCDACTVARTGSTGVCRTYENCPTALTDIRQHGQYPTRCGFIGPSRNIPIICCPVPPTRRTTRPPRLERRRRISERKCLEYSQLAYVNNTIRSFSGGSVTIKESICGFTSVPLIVGGTAAKPMEFPHMALLGYRKGNKVEWGCGGTLISDRYILTAAHCLYSTQLGSVKLVRLGDLDWKSTTDESSPIDIPIQRTIKHPDNLSTKYNDIALLRLTRRVVFNKYIRPACLPSHFRIPTNKAIATGWGQVAWVDRTSNILLKVTLDFISHPKCKEEFEWDATDELPNGIVDATQVCAGSLDEDVEMNTCQGDSGGPLQIYHPDELHCMYSVVGVTSFGKACDSAPGVYTRVYPYLDWIEQTVW